MVPELIDKVPVKSPTISLQNFTLSLKENTKLSVTPPPLHTIINIPPSPTEKSHSLRQASGKKSIKKENDCVATSQKFEIFDFGTIPLISQGDNRPFVLIQIGNHHYTALLDSGANCTVLGRGCYQLVEELELQKFEATGAISTADNTRYSVEHFVWLPISFHGRTATIAALMIPSLNKNIILGMDFWESFGIQPMSVSCIEATEDESGDEIHLSKPESVDNPHMLSQSEAERLREVVNKFPKSDQGSIGRTHLVEHVIDTGEYEPVKQRHHPVSPYVQAKIDVEIARMLEMDVIEKSTSPWSLPLVCVPKASGKMRVCLDARRLNALTKKMSYPLPHISMILGQLNRAKFISAVDLSEAFWQIPLEDKSKEKTAFVVPGRGLFQFKVMPFGLVNAAASQSRMMDMAIGVDLQPNVFVYLDDIIICADTFELHMSLLEEVAKRIKAAGLTIGSEKSKFCCKELRYLGHTLNENGIGTNEDKVQTIVEFPKPKTIKQLKRFLGMTQWYSRFIEDYAKTAAPLTDLTKGNPIHLSWNETADTAFKALKRALSSTPVLAMPDYNRPFYIQTDASDIGIGAILMQKFDGEEKVIAYTSYKFKKAEKRYMTTEKELYAIVKGIEKFLPYIQGVKFFVITDHSALQYLKTAKHHSARLSRWSMKLQSLDFEVFHRKGKQNVVPDTLSRAIELIDYCVIDMPSDDQSTDWYANLKKEIAKKPKAYENYRIDNDKVFKFIKCNKKDGCYATEWKEVVCDNRKIDILKQFHDDVTAGHMGVGKTAMRIKANYFWPGVDSDVRKYVRKCEICAANKVPNTFAKPPMGKQRFVSQPWQIISMDFLGPYPRSKNGNTTMLVVTDMFSKWVELFPMRSAVSKKVIEFLENRIFLTFGIPKVIISDNGSQFVSKEMKAFLEQYGVKQWLNNHYHPQSNPTERTNRSILTCIRSYIGQSHKDWDQKIAQIGCALRTGTHTASKYSPYFLNFGKEMPGVSDAQMPEPQELVVRDAEKDEHVMKVSGLNDIWRKVRNNLKKAYESSRAQYNRRTVSKVFAADDMVWRKNFVLSDASKNFTAKFAPRYQKCRVIRKIGSNSYELADMNGKRIGVWNACDLKPARDANTRQNTKT